MFQTRYFQMKDQMEMFEIVRDTIKYYESIGLITSERRENGYRVFDEVNTIKLKKILSFRSVNMTIDEIRQIFTGETEEERIQAISAARIRTEKELCRQTENLRKIRFFEKRVSRNICYVDHFNLEQDLVIHINCTTLTDINDKIFYNTVGGYASFIPEKGIFDEHACNLLVERPDNILGLICDHARRTYLVRECMRARIVYQSKEHLEKLLAELYENLRLQGQHAAKQFYVSKKVVQIDGEDRLIFDIIVPLVD